jgi:lipopolysaccharide transport system ATP-binding protein
VDLTVPRGEAIGLVGTNGSGKSTLLQIVAGTTLPTEGEVRVCGRVLPLLAVGHGFHPDLTGRENVTLFASSLGIPRATIEDQMEAVTAFAELEHHLDTPVKRFSSGMVSRLSFAIAVQFPADIYVSTRSWPSSTASSRSDASPRSSDCTPREGPCCSSATTARRWWRCVNA